MKTTPCAKCKRPIIFANTKKKGKEDRRGCMPVDAEPVPGGNVLLENKDGELWATVLGTPDVREAAVRDGKPLYINHFATCPFAQDFRRK